MGEEDRTSLIEEWVPRRSGEIGGDVKVGCQGGQHEWLARNDLQNVGCFQIMAEFSANLCICTIV
jgi:hypothetical protein